MSKQEIRIQRSCSYFFNLNNLTQQISALISEYKI